MEMKILIIEFSNKGYGSLFQVRKISHCLSQWASWAYLSKLYKQFSNCYVSYGGTRNLAFFFKFKWTSFTPEDVIGAIIYNYSNFNYHF